MTRTKLVLTATVLASACAKPSIHKAPRAEPMPTIAKSAEETPGNDFVADVVYEDDHGQPFATRWVHGKTAMPVTILNLQSVPQVFLHVNTPPVSDRGEPHTGEHLLLGKGGRGKTLQEEQGMAFVDSTAYTSQTDVVYSWNCAAGKETFYRTIGQYLTALFLPDYTDEEVRREVCNVGVVKDDKTGALSLDEKGTIYNEMVSSYEKRWRSWYALKLRVWGNDHPNAMSSGGRPDAIREMEPHHIHDFHRAHYTPSANVGMIVALPSSVPAEEFLRVLSRDLRELEQHPEIAARPRAVHEIPPARPQPGRGLELVPYPNKNPDEGGFFVMAWPPTAHATQRDQVLAELFLAVLGNGERSLLYKQLMDSATRKVTLDASELSAWVESTRVDGAAYLALDGYPPRNARAEVVDQVVLLVRAEVARVAGLPAKSDALAEVNQKALVSLTERERGLKKSLSTPPLFGHRSAGGFWLDHLRLVDLEPGKRRSMTLTPLFRELRATLEAGENPWGAVIAALKMNEPPYVSVSVPSPQELEKLGSEEQARLDAFASELVSRYGAADRDAAIRRYSDDYDRATAELATRDAALPRPRLVKDVPLTMDPSLILEPAVIANVKGHRGVFDNMSFVEVALYLGLDSVKGHDLPWLALLPALMTRAGVVEDGTAIPYDVMKERVAREIYALDADYAMRPERGRHELVLRASGASAAEGKRALEWMKLTLESPWLAPENLPRLRDLVRQEIRDVRTRLGGSEERWVRNPATAVRFQDDPLYLSAVSYHTRLLHLARLDWMLLDPPSRDDATRIRRALEAMVAAASDDPKATIDKMGAVIDGAVKSGGEVGKRWVSPVAERIRELVADMAPASIQRDVKDLVDIAMKDLEVEPGAALREARELLATLRAKRGSRFVMTGSRATMDELTAPLAQVLSSFGDAAQAACRASGGAPWISRRVDDRLGEHEATGPDPVHYGLVHGGGTSGVLVLGVDSPGLDELAPDTLIDELASAVYGGAGAHGFFMNTWGAGLAYSNGLNFNPISGRLGYYAERCPDPVETMKFVTGLLARSAELPDLGEYAVARLVDGNRESDEYESRAKAAAEDLVDGDVPERVRKYREAVLALDRATLWQKMAPRLVASAGKVLPGIGPRSRDAAGAVMVAIAPEPLLARWEGWVQEHEGGGERVYRVYPRDFWLLPGSVPERSAAWQECAARTPPGP